MTRIFSSILLPFFFLGSLVSNRLVGKKGTLLIKGPLRNLDYEFARVLLLL